MNENDDFEMIDNQNFNNQNQLKRSFTSSQSRKRGKKSKHEVEEFQISIFNSDSNAVIYKGKLSTSQDKSIIIENDFAISNENIHLKASIQLTDDFKYQLLLCKQTKYINLLQRLESFDYNDEKTNQLVISDYIRNENMTITIGESKPFKWGSFDIFWIKQNTPSWESEYTDNEEEAMEQTSDTINIRFTNNKTIELLINLLTLSHDTKDKYVCSLAPFVKKNKFKYYTMLRKIFHVLSCDTTSAGHYLIGCCYNVGFGIKKNNDLAVYHLSISASQNHKFAQFELGRILTFETDTFYKGIELIDKSAKQNVIRSLRYISYRNCRKLLNYKAGINQLQTLVDLNDPLGNFALGLAYYHGRYGLTTDKEKGIELVLKSAYQNYVKAEQWIITNIKNRDF